MSDNSQGQRQGRQESFQPGSPHPAFSDAAAAQQAHTAALQGAEAARIAAGRRANEIGAAP